MPAHRIVLERRLGRKSKNANLRSQLEGMMSTALKGQRGKGWRHTIGKISLPREQKSAKAKWVYTVTVTIVPTQNRESLQNKVNSILERLAKAGCAGQLKSNPWKIIDPEGWEGVAVEAKETAARKTALKAKEQEGKELGSFSIDAGDNFSRMFGRGAQERRIMSSIRLAHETELLVRPHMLFCGDPGGGKTEMTMCLQNMMGEEGVAWRRYDAPSMTKAGALEDILESDYVPPFLFIEEIEKVDADTALRWLLGVMDERGVVQRTNYRVGNQAKNVRMVVIATCNDVKLLKKVMYGALYSRFKGGGGVINFPYPDRDTMRLILERDLVELKQKGKQSNPAWIEPTLKFAYDECVIRDPREALSIMRIGQNALLESGQFQQDYLATMSDDDREEMEAHKKEIAKRESKKK